MKTENCYNRRGISNNYAQQEINLRDDRLAIQRLRKGSLKDVEISHETYAYGDRSGNLFEGLKEYIRTSASNEQTPTYIFDNHNMLYTAGMKRSLKGK